MVTPSANVVVERVTTAILSDFPEVSAHFSRTPVYGSRDLFPDDYDWEGMLGAATLLAQAQPDIIAWNGSKGAMLGLSVDQEFCRRVEDKTGIRATTSTIALHSALDVIDTRRIAIVSPYMEDYQQKLVSAFKRQGFYVVADACLRIDDNLAFAAASDTSIAEMVYRVAEAKPDAILTWCTNFPAAFTLPKLEDDLDIPILDSVSLTVWNALRLTGHHAAEASRWGRLFDIQFNSAC
ncbi:maleate cis-trans isomerase family protein [Rhizobium sullae]|uniref:maleate cis-trans isomerase family protein n=1 Tax=Rhizobium sullae TaxID=50338 RepID=UPI00117BA077|nr:Asp/Glu/hydantoin racemase [Rhizobium sullae]